MVNNCRCVRCLFQADGVHGVRFAPLLFLDNALNYMSTMATHKLKVLITVMFMFHSGSCTSRIGNLLFISLITFAVTSICFIKIFKFTDHAIVL